jgi:hypothetical protein
MIFSITACSNENNVEMKEVKETKSQKASKHYAKGGSHKDFEVENGDEVLKELGF